MRGSKGLPEVHQPQPPRLLLPLQMPQQIQPPQAQFLPQVALPQVQVPYAIPLPPERQQGQLPFATLLARGQVQLPYAIPLEPSRNVQLPFATLVAPPQQGQPPLVVPLARARQAEPLLAFPLEPPCPVQPPLAVPPVPLPQQNQQEFPRMMPPRNLVLPSHHQQRLMMFWQDQLRQIQENGYIKNNQLPVARIKKIIKKDETVNMISSEVPILFSKACESFICDLTLHAWLHTEDDNRRTLQRNDISSAITRTDIFDFLIDIVPRNREIETNDYHSLRNNNIYGDGDGGDTNIERGQDEMLESDDSSDNGVTIAYNANIGITDVNDGDTIAYPGIDREDVDDGVTIARSGIDSADVNDGITIAYNPGIGRTDVNDGVTIAHPGNGITNVNAGAGSSAVLAEMMYMHWYQLSVMHYGYMNMIGRYMSEYQQYSRAVLEMSSEEDDNSDG